MVLAFSPDEKKLYVAQSDPKKAIWMEFPVLDNGLLGDGKLFYDATSSVGNEHPGLPDGLTVDSTGNVWASGPGGIWVFSPAGKLLAKLETANAQATANSAKTVPRSSSPQTRTYVE